MDVLRVHKAPGLGRLASLAAALLLLAAPNNGVLGQAQTSSGFEGFYVANPTSSQCLPGTVLRLASSSSHLLTC